MLMMEVHFVDGVCNFNFFYSYLWFWTVGLNFFYWLGSLSIIRRGIRLSFIDFVLRNLFMYYNNCKMDISPSSTFVKSFVFGFVGNSSTLQEMAAFNVPCVCWWLGYFSKYRRPHSLFPLATRPPHMRSSVVKLSFTFAMELEVGEINFMDYFC